MMRTAIGLSVITGMPWEYFAEQEDRRVVATYVDILDQAHKGRTSKRPDGDEDKPKPGDFPIMSG